MSQPDSPLPPLLRFSHEAMNTLFEISIAGEEPEYARQAAAEVFAEVDRLEGRLSRFVENSEISRINRLSGLDAVPVSEQTLECLRVAKVVSQATGGAFDATLGTLLALRPSESASRREPAPEELNAARDRTGMDLLELDETALTARLTVPGVQIDLGAIGKGYAIDQGVAILREWGIGAAMLDGGGSSLYALGAPEGRAGWPLGVGVGADEMDPDDRRILLRDLALSASGTAFLGSIFLIREPAVPPSDGRCAPGRSTPRPRWPMPCRRPSWS